MSEDFSQFVAECRQRVDSALQNLLPVTTGPGERLRDAMRYSLFNGGKRVRPILAYASGLAVGDTLTQAQQASLDAVACALECVHAYSLVHDDLPAMDDDDLRRGKPTCHIAFDEATAILAGDALQTLAFELLSDAPHLDAACKLALLQQLTRASGVRGMVLGQAIDLAAVNQQLNLDQLETMHRHKTGALISASVAMGAIVCGADATRLQALTTYADAIGLAFQVQDDILDVTTDTAILGKQQGADVARNKPTYVSLLGLDNARAKAQELHQQALAALADFDQRAQPLRALSAYIIERSH
ncbi:(2E,6E)-farnesyl diphosphate synthase [Cellvibrio sp. ARAG 10.3]|uniref:(2E,6E)-farnesyl diphosphate synthase n=1 Tax=Cellvibrio sp. ARAG 10.3 TaxID=3451358 RepID=UPI003F465149